MSAASDATCSTYYETVPENERTGPGVWSAMDKAIAKCVKHWRSQMFDKMVVIANPANGELFEQEVFISVLLIPVAK